MSPRVARPGFHQGLYRAFRILPSVRISDGLLFWNQGAERPMVGSVHFFHIFFNGPACLARPVSEPASVNPKQVTCPECRRYLQDASVEVGNSSDLLSLSERFGPALGSGHHE